MRGVRGQLHNAVHEDVDHLRTQGAAGSMRQHEQTTLINPCAPVPSTLLLAMVTVKGHTACISH